MTVAVGPWIPTEVYPAPAECACQPNGCGCEYKPEAVGFKHSDGCLGAPASCPCPGHTAWRIVTGRKGEVAP